MSALGADLLRQRIHGRVMVDANGCWVWTGARSTTGYGRVRDIRFGKSVYAHRLAYELFVAPIPEGLTIDHLCRVRLCVNPAHLEPVTQRENNLRGYSGELARRTHCKRAGHLLDEANTMRDLNGWRSCKECHRERQSAYWHRVKCKCHGEGK